MPNTVYGNTPFYWSTANSHINAINYKMIIKGRIIVKASQCAQSVQTVLGKGCPPLPATTVQAHSTHFQTYATCLHLHLVIRKGCCLIAIHIHINEVTYNFLCKVKIIRQRTGWHILLSKHKLYHWVRKRDKKKTKKHFNNLLAYGYSDICFCDVHL